MQRNIVEDLDTIEAHNTKWTWLDDTKSYKVKDKVEILSDLDFIDGDNNQVAIPEESQGIITKVHDNPSCRKFDIMLPNGVILTEIPSTLIALLEPPAPNKESAKGWVLAACFIVAFLLIFIFIGTNLINTTASGLTILAWILAMILSGIGLGTITHGLSHWLDMD